MDPLSERLKNMTPLQRAVFALKETQARLDALERRQNEPIAIVGMACRFPGGATDPASFWRLLCDGVDAVGEVPPDRWNVDDFYDPDPAAPGKMSTRCGGFLQRIDEFDNHFFAISDSEAARIDPQQRILLELAWEALEDAGLPPSTLRGTKIGVFIGISLSEYGLMLSSDLAQTNAHAAAGTSLCLAANRLSFALGLQGPSMALDTACSSSLVAVHLACQCMRNGECDAALVGGSSLLLSPIATVNLTKAGFCAADGRVRAFDAAASGYVRSEGAGLVVLKPLADALKNNDPLYAVIRGSAVNQNGSSNGLTAPSRAAQEQVLREAYARAQVSPGQVRFVETQGTGTRLGDAIEAMALGNVLRQDRPPDSYCAIGALKTNIGHLEAASGVAGLMKAALTLKHRQLPPNLHFQTPNPDIPFGMLPLQVQRKLEAWPDATHPRFAGVSAFGFGGSNAHVVLEEPPASTAGSAAARARGRHLLPLSARTEKALHALARRYGELLRGDPPSWCDICHTAAERRDHHDCRLAVLADSQQQAADLLTGFLSGQAQPEVFAGRKPYGRALKIAFVYSGRAETWKPFRLQLADLAAGFAAAMGEIDAALQRVAGWPLAAVLSDEARWDDPVYAWPALLALQLALAAWWRRGNIGPDVVLGQGVGELAAACAAGIVTAEEALRIAVACGRGEHAAPLNGRQYRAASLPFLSALDGQSHAGPDLDAAHWRSCMGCCEGLAAAVSALCDRHVDVCLEIGPAALIESNPRLRAADDHSWLAMPSLLPANTAVADVLTAVGSLYAAGADFLWGRLAPTHGRCVRVPTYPWQRQRLWVQGQNRLAMAPAATTRPAEAEAEAPPGDASSQMQQPATEQAAAVQLSLRPELTSPYVAPQTRLEEAMAEAWSAILRIERIGVHDNFFELGGDSLQATILLNRLQEHLGEAVPGHVLFQVQTIRDLAAYVRRHCPDAVWRQYPEEAVAGSEEPALCDTMTMGAGGAARDKGETPPADAPSIPRLARHDQAEQLLARLDELSDDEVQSLLASAMADEEASHE